MTDQPTEFDLLMARVRNGSQDAARELFDKYGGHVRRIVRRKLHQRLRTQYDSTDFTQAVWASFFATPTDNFAFTSPDALVAFLAGVASHKITDAHRRSRAAKRDALREQPLPTEESGGVGVPRDPRQPTPSQVAIANERWEQILDGQPSYYRLALEMLRHGHTLTETSSRLGINPKKIRLLLRQLQGESSGHE